MVDIQDNKIQINIKINNDENIINEILSKETNEIISKLIKAELDYNYHYNYDKDNVKNNNEKLKNLLNQIHNLTLDDATPKKKINQISQEDILPLINNDDDDDDFNYNNIKKIKPSYPILIPGLNISLLKDDYKTLITTLLDILGRDQIERIVIGKSFLTCNHDDKLNVDLSNSNECKINSSEGIFKRWSHTYKYQLFDSMYILQTFETEDEALDLERTLINAIKDDKSLEAYMPESNDNEGNRTKKKSDVYLTYLAFKKKVLVETTGVKTRFYIPQYELSEKFYKIYESSFKDENKEEDKEVEKKDEEKEVEKKGEDIVNSILSNYVNGKKVVHNLCEIKILYDKYDADYIIKLKNKLNKKIFDSCINAFSKLKIEINKDQITYDSNKNILLHLSEDISPKQDENFQNVYEILNGNGLKYSNIKNKLEAQYMDYNIIENHCNSRSIINQAAMNNKNKIYYFIKKVFEKEEIYKNFFDKNPDNFNKNNDYYFYFELIKKEIVTRKILNNCIYLSEINCDQFNYNYVSTNDLMKIKSAIKIHYGLFYIKLNKDNTWNGSTGLVYQMKKNIKNNYIVLKMFENTEKVKIEVKTFLSKFFEKFDEKFINSCFLENKLRDDYRYVFYLTLIFEK